MPGKFRPCQVNTVFAQLYIAMQSRDANLEEFFSHEVQSYPPSLSEFGKLRLPATKSDLLKCICSQHPEPPAEFDCKIYDDAVIVHCLPVTGAVTSEDYAEKMFLPFTSKAKAADGSILSGIPMSLITSMKRPLKLEGEVCEVKSLVVARSS